MWPPARDRARAPGAPWSRRPRPSLGGTPKRSPAPLPGRSLATATLSLLSAYVSKQAFPQSETSKRTGERSGALRLKGHCDEKPRGRLKGGNRHATRRLWRGRRPALRPPPAPRVDVAELIKAPSLSAPWAPGGPSCRPAPLEPPESCGQARSETQTLLRVSAARRRFLGSSSKVRRGAWGESFPRQPRAATLQPKQKIKRRGLSTLGALLLGGRWRLPAGRKGGRAPLVRSASRGHRAWGHWSLFVSGVTAPRWARHARARSSVAAPLPACSPTRARVCGTCPPSSLWVWGPEDSPPVAGDGGTHPRRPPAPARCSRWPLSRRCRWAVTHVTRVFHIRDHQSTWQVLV